MQYGGDSTILGRAGDALRGITGTMSPWLNATIPSHQRAMASDAAIGKAAGKAFDYLNTHTPEQTGADIASAVSKAWSRLEADHARAAAQGPEAEARWLGQITGRASFEIASFAVPVTKAALIGKAANAAAHTAEAAVDVARVGDTAADGVKVASAIGDANKLGLVGKTAGIAGAAGAADKAGDVARAGNAVADGSRVSDGAKVVNAAGDAGRAEKVAGKLNDFSIPKPVPKFSFEILQQAKRTGIPPEKIQELLDLKKAGQILPPPETYMPAKQITAHLAKFDEGIVRVISRSIYEKYGTLELR